MSSAEDSLKHECMLDLRWSVTKMIQSYESDPKLAYIHGFDAAIALLRARARLSNSAIGEGTEELAAKLAAETANTFRSMLDEKERLLCSRQQTLRLTGLESEERKL